MKNFKLIILTLIAVIAVSTANAQYSQTWIATYDNGAYDNTIASVRDAAGNTYITGSSSNGTGFDLLTVKYNSSGVQQWAARHTSGGTTGNEGHDITLDASGNVYVTGRAGNPVALVAIKYNSAGVQQWIASYAAAGIGGNLGKTIKVDNSGNVYVGGEAYSGAATQSDLIAVKFNSMGVTEWASIYNSSAFEEANEMAMDVSGSIYVCGKKSDGMGGYDMVLSKWNSSGAHEWAVTYDSGSSGEAYGLVTDNTGNIIITGIALNITTIKYNSSGVQQWVRTYTGVINNADAAYDITADASGNTYIAGYTYTGATVGTANIITIKYNASGVQQWASLYNGPGNHDDEAWAVTVDSYGNVYTGGFSEGIGTMDDFTVIKYNASGVQQWVSRTNGTANSWDICRKIMVDNQQNIYASGMLYGTGGGNCYLVKYSALTGIQINTGEIPSTYSLSQNYPNPFNPVTNFEFSVPVGAIHESPVKLAVYNSLGKEVAVLVNEPLNAGVYNYSFDGTGLNSGVYFYRLEAGEFTETKKMLLLK